MMRLIILLSTLAALCAYAALRLVGRRLRFIENRLHKITVEIETLAAVQNDDSQTLCAIEATLQEILANFSAP